MVFIYQSLPNGGHRPPTGDARVAEDGREDPKSKEGITSTSKPFSSFGISVVFTPNTPQSFDSSAGEGEPVLQ